MENQPPTEIDLSTKNKDTDTPINGLTVGRTVVRLLSETFRGKVYPLFAPTDTAPPFCVYSRESITREEDKDGTALEVTKISLFIVADSYETAIKKAEETDNCMTKNRLFRLVDADEAFYIDSNLFTQTLIYTL